MGGYSSTPPGRKERYIVHLVLNINFDGVIFVIYMSSKDDKKNYHRCLFYNNIKKSGKKLA